MSCPRLYLAALLAGVPGIGTASMVELPRTEGAVTIDGVLDDAAWQDAAQIKIDTETRPGENIPARVRTTAYLAEDGVNLYVAFDAEDPDSSAIRAYLRDRDSAWNDDFVGIVLDTYGDERRAFEFFANALGVQMDLTMDDVNGNEDESWDAIWSSAGRIHDAGYVVEMQIPLNQLRFPRQAGKQTWGIDLLRFYPRDHRYRFSNNAQDRNVNCYLCQIEKIQGLAGVEPGRDLEIVPTLTALQSAVTAEPGVVPLKSGSADIEVGASIRWGITPDMTANLALNPDFSQVEADVAQLDVNNQFALFFAEKRPFFLEGADYFSTPIQAVFTRTVADPSVGAKLTSKRGRNTFGIFAAEDEITNLLFPGAFGSDSESLLQRNTAFVGRYSRAFGDTSYVGGLLTGRRGTGYHNYVGGLDLRWKINDQHSVHVQHLRSDTGYPLQVAIDFEQPRDAFDGDATEAQYDFDSRDWFAYLRHAERSATFRADSGFVPQVDVEKQVVGLGRNWHAGEGDWYSRFSVSGDWDITHDDSGRLLEREIESRINLGGPMQSSFELGALTRERRFEETLYDQTRFSVFAEFQPRGGLKLGIWAEWGDQIDFANSRAADERRLEPYVNWNANRFLLLRYQGRFVRLDSTAGARIFDADVHDVRATWQFSVRSFLRLTAQLRDVERNAAEYVEAVEARSRRVGRQLLYSYKLNPQTVFFLGYSDALIDDDDLSGLTTTDRSFFLKIGYAWTP